VTLRRIILLLGAAWVLAWLWLGRYAMLDDALIHLRYAEILARTHLFSFDGVHASFGCSSPLYVVLLAALQLVTASPLLPKVVSVVFYAGLLAWHLWHAQRDRGAGAILGWILLLVCISPMAQRWLADGMETSLVGLCAVLLATIAVHLASREQRPSATEYVALAGCGTFLVWLRVDLGLIVALASAGLVLWRVESAPAQGRWKRLLLESCAQSHLALGALLGMGLLRVVMGQVLPDTAIAKTGTPMSFFDASHLVASVSVSSFSFGTGVLFVWLASAALALRHLGRRHVLSLLAGNAAVLILVLLIARRGQSIQGIRHVLWGYWFGLAWNLQALRTGVAVESRPARGVWTIAAVAAVLMAVWVIEAPITYRIFRFRSDAFVDMRAQNLSVLQDKTGVACDVGFISYFTKARILDLDGLVNGRRFAEMPAAERLRYAATQSPDFTFLTQKQGQDIDSVIPMAGFVPWHDYLFQNVRETPRHFLSLRADLAQQLGVTAQPR
jgi:hypothetical protein